MTCPDNYGLFQKAVIHSAMIKDPYGFGIALSPDTLKVAEEKGKTFFEFLGVETIEEARKLDSLFIRDKYNEYAKTNPRMMTVIDDKFCFGDPLALYMQNKHARVPVMSGNTGDEFLHYISAESDDEFEDKANKSLGKFAKEFLEIEEVWKKENNKYAIISGTECTVKSIFQQNNEYGNTKNYYYCFDAEIPGWDNPGTFHSVDLWFFFETLAKCWRPFTGKHYDLARHMCDYFCNFIKTGNPNGLDINGEELLYWDTYSKDNPKSMVFSSDGSYIEEEDSKQKKILIKKIKEDLMQ